MTVEVSHGRPRPRAIRADRPPRTAAAELAAPFRDPATGRFGSGNPGGRLRQVAAIGRLEAESLLALAIGAVAPWLRGHLSKAQRHVQGLIDALPAQTDELVALCGLEAKCLLLANALVTEGAREDVPPDTAKAAREEARTWMRELRQFALTRQAIARNTTPASAGSSPSGRVEDHARRILAERSTDDATHEVGT